MTLNDLEGLRSVSQNDLQKYYNKASYREASSLKTLSRDLNPHTQEIVGYVTSKETPPSLFTIQILKSQFRG